MLSRRIATLHFRWSLLRLALRFVDDEDTWRSLDHDVPLHHFGAGIQGEFSWYLEGESRVPVRDVEELAAWLAGCEYVRDPELFRVRDFWQHPRTFEQLRRGDCEDHALWAWWRLRQLGLAAELVVGHWRQRGERHADARHAWVVHTTAAGARYLIESVDKDPRRMIRPFPAAREEYVPHVSIDTALTRRLYAGYVATLAHERAQRRRSRFGDSETSDPDAGAPDPGAPEALRRAPAP